MRRYLFLALLLIGQSWCVKGQRIHEILPGVFQISFGDSTQFTPERFRDAPPRRATLTQLPAGTFPFKLSDIKVTQTARGVIVSVPLAAEEQLYGFGLQMGSFRQNGLRKVPVVNDNPLNNLGYSHAPVPYYVSNKGYAVLVNTAKYTTFYCGSNQPKPDVQSVQKNDAGTKLSVEELYQSHAAQTGNVLVDIPGVKGITLYLFAGPDMRTAVQRYNLFSGGGALPPLWGLGVKYRVKADFKQADVYQMAKYFRAHQIRVSVIGLEPRWQTASYPCSFVWNPDFFYNPQKMLNDLKNEGYRINLWEHAFVSPASPLYPALFHQSGDYLAFDGLVPDFVNPKTRELFGAFHKTRLIDSGVSGFKLDECDNSDLRFGNARWSFPELSQFPSGIDGEQMHQLFGLLYQKTIYDVYKNMNLRTYLDVRSSGALASPYPAALYSDTYNHQEYVEQIANSGFSGLLWSPEVRESSSFRELARRSQTAILSAQTLYNSWYLQHPPWLQYDKDKNNRNELLPTAAENEATIRKLLDFRMRLIPYLYQAFRDYEQQGIPVFRALVMDYPQDQHVADIASEYMIGTDLLASPIVGDADSREVYLPAGNWYNINNNQKYTGGQSYHVSFNLDEIPLFVREGTILPLANPEQFVGDQTVFHLTCYVYGNPNKAGHLFEDDGISFNYTKQKFNELELKLSGSKVTVTRKGNFHQKRYVIDRTVQIP